MPFDATPTDDGGDDPDAALRAWASIRISCAEAMVANGAAHHLREAAFLVGQIVHAVWEFWMINGYEPDLGLLGEQLDLLRMIARWHSSQSLWSSDPQSKPRHCPARRRPTCW
jgi:hypothetical protein